MQRRYLFLIDNECCITTRKSGVGGFAYFQAAKHLTKMMDASTSSHRLKSGLHSCASATSSPRQKPGFLMYITLEQFVSRNDHRPTRRLVSTWNSWWELREFWGNDRKKMWINPSKKQRLCKWKYSRKHGSYWLCEFVNNHKLLLERDCKWWFEQDFLEHVFMTCRCSRRCRVIDP